MTYVISICIDYKKKTMPDLIELSNKIREIIKQLEPNKITYLSINVEEMIDDD